MEYEYLKESLRNNIRSAKKVIKKAGRYKAFKIYLEEKQIQTNFGLSRSNIYSLKDKIEKAETVDELQLLERHVEEFSVNAEAFYKAKNLNSSIFFNTQFYIYFFYRKKHNVSKVMLGRAVLKINELGKVYIKNIKDGSEDYEGSFEIIHDHAMFLDLKSLDSDSRLHMKIETGSRPREISIGLSLGYEVGSIIAGTVVLEKRSNEDELLPKSMTHLDSEFHEVSLVIRKFLAIKKYNQLKIPREKGTYVDLDNFIEFHKTDKRTNFFDQERPLLFISTPTDSIDSKTHTDKKKIINELITRLETEISTYAQVTESDFQLDIRYPGAESLRDANNPLEKLKIQQNQIRDFNLIQRVKLFVLIFEREVVSKSLIELGIALHNAECILVFHKKNVNFPDLDALENNDQFRHFKVYEFEEPISSSETQEYFLQTIFLNIIRLYPDIKSSFNFHKM